jgi:large subunit ribosomal protein L35
MPKIKTRKSVSKRIKITSTGKFLKGSINNSHLKRKEDSSSRARKARSTQISKGFAKRIKKMMPGVK